MVVCPEFKLPTMKDCGDHIQFRWLRDVSCRARGYLADAALAFAFGMSCVLGGGAVQADVPVDMELVLAVDVSRSVDFNEGWLQRQGYIEAFGHPEVISAIQRGYHGKIAVSYVEWAGFGHNEVIVPWTLVHDAASAEIISTALKRSNFGQARRTSISDAIDFAAGHFDPFQFSSSRRVIDVSGDGANNWGGLVTQARDRTIAAGITINGLPIVNKDPEFGGFQQITNLDLYYKNCVIGGRGAFIVVAEGFDDFSRAVRRKLVQEIAGVPQPEVIKQASFRPAYSLGARTPTMPMAMPAVMTAADNEERATPSCDIGERMWRKLFDY